jgi:hypothetical protein
MTAMEAGHSYASSGDALVRDLNKFAADVFQPGYTVEQQDSMYVVRGTFAEGRELTGLFQWAEYHPDLGFFSVDRGNGAIWVGNQIDLNTGTGPLTFNMPACLGCYVSQWRFT